MLRRQTVFNLVQGKDNSNNNQKQQQHKQQNLHQERRRKRRNSTTEHHYNFPLSDLVSLSSKSGILTRKRRIANSRKKGTKDIQSSLPSFSSICCSSPITSSNSLPFSNCSISSSSSHISFSSSTSPLDSSYSSTSPLGAYLDTLPTCDQEDSNSQKKHHIFWEISLDQDLLETISAFYPEWFCDHIMMDPPPPPQEGSNSRKRRESGSSLGSPRSVVDDSSLQQSMDRNKESLKVKLLLRRPVTQLVEQGILPREYPHYRTPCILLTN